MQRQALEPTHNSKEKTMKIVKLMLAAVTAGLMAGCAGLPASTASSAPLMTAPSAVPRYSIELFRLSSKGAWLGERCARMLCWGAVMPKLAVPQTPEESERAGKAVVHRG